MGVDTKLYLSTRWDLDDIKQVIERTAKTAIKIESHHSFAPGYFTFSLVDRQRMIHVHTNNQIPTGTATLLSMAANDEGQAILKDIAHCLGGLFMAEDYTGTLEPITGNISDENHLAYFLKHAIIKDGIGPDDIKGLLQSMSKWYDDIQPDSKPPFLTTMLH